MTAEAETLTQTELDMLAMERLWWQFAGAKEQKIRERFNMSTLRYCQVLNELIDRDDVLAHDPLLVKRLRRLRAQRKRSRSPRRLGVGLRGGRSCAGRSGSCSRSSPSSPSSTESSTWVHR